jgi:membrane fusion protein, multidrug efflux system
MQNRTPIDLAPILAALLCCSACSPKGAEVAAAPPALPPAAAATSVPASETGFKVSGPLIVEHQLELLAQRDGVIAELRSEAGARVQTGDLLAKLDDRQLVADLEAARARTRSTEADLRNWEAEAKVMQSDYERAQKMWDAQIIPKEQLEHARFKAESEMWDVRRVTELLTNAQQSEHSLELELDKTRIRAPFPGVVARRYIRLGQQVARGDRLFWVTAEGPLQMRFTLPERFIGQLRTGEELQMTTPDLPDQQYKVRVREVSPVVDPASSTIEVTVEIKGKPGSLRPGMEASVSLPNLP